MRLRSTSSLTVVASLTFLLLSKASFGQTPAPAAGGTVSAADRQAARDLFVDGFNLQNAGKCDAALERYRRAEQVYPAVTTELRIAECQATLGLLVESSETYRQVIQAHLPSDASPAFHTAQQQASAELPQVEPRVPLLEIDVTPAGAPGLEVSVDGQTLNAALVGVKRPINPGTHHVTVRATGYATAENDVTVKERQRDAVLPVALQAKTGAAMAPLPPPTGATGTADDGSAQKQPLPNQYVGPGAEPDSARTSIIIGGRLGVGGIAGNLLTGIKASNRVAGGGSLGLEMGVRFAQYLFVGVAGEYVGYGAGDGSGPGVVGNATSTQHSEMVGLLLGVMSNPHGALGFYGELGADYRWLDVDTQNSSSYSVTFDNPETFSGAEFLVGGGATIHPSKNVLIIPKLELGIGTFSTYDNSSCNGGGEIDCAKTNGLTTATHMAAMLSVGLYFDKGIGNGSK